MSTATTETLSHILRHRWEFETVDDLAPYKRIRVQLHQRGVVLRDIVEGASIQTKEQQRCRTGDVVFAEIDAKVGGYGIIPAELDGAIVSSHYYLFEIDKTRADPKYVEYVLRWPGFQDQVRARGSTNYAAIRAQNVLDYVIPLPGLDEQRQIGEKLDTIVRDVMELKRRAAKVDASSAATLFPSLAERIFLRRTSAVAPVSDFATIISDVVHPGDDPLPAQSFVGLQHIESHTGRQLGEMPLGGEKGRKFRFRPGDILYGYLRPYLNKVWLADRHGLCSVDQYVLRPMPGVRAGLLAHSLRSQAFLRRAIDLTHSLQLPRLRSGLLLDVEIPVVDAHRSECVELELDLALDRVLSLVHFRRIQSSKLEALNPSILNRAFNSGF